LLIGLLDERGRAGAATVLTALHGPSQVRHRGVAFPPRLVDRLASGLVVAVEPMGERTRLRFLQALAEESRLSVSVEVLGWLAEQLPGGGRHLEGAVRQLQLLQRTQKKPLQLKDLRPHFVIQGPPVQRIAAAVCGYYRVAPKKVQSPRRSRDVVLPRQVSMYLARRLCRLPLQKIGAYFGGRDHKTVLHACGKLEIALESDARLRGAIRHLTTQLT
jgi:chromosomal replication initiator protein